MTSGDRVLIASMPWALSYMASIQVGALKSFLKENGVKAEGGHWFLPVANHLGFGAYGELCYPHLSDGEALYAYLLFPEKRDSLLSDEHLRRKFRILQGKYGTGSNPKFSLTEDFFERFAEVNNSILDRYNWSEYRLVGFTLNFGQTLASLYMAREIKLRSPDTKIIFGGSEACGDLGKSLLNEFSFLDYCCDGEGELPLLGLCRALESDGDVGKINGIMPRSEELLSNGNHSGQMPKMTIPVPDFSDYFDEIATLGLNPNNVTACLPIEGSRGCYYDCSFCALNLQWDKFRAQTPEMVALTISQLSSRHKLLDFFFVDNIAPKTSKKIFKRVEDLGLDLRFFYELRTDINRDTLSQMKAAGLTRVQLGVESLSSGLLKKFNKRARVIDNLQGMKFCEEFELSTCGNLIVEHPKTTQIDVEESVRNIEFCTAFRPPNAFAPFDLEFGAPDYEGLSPQWLSIDGNHEEYLRLYPRPIFERLNLLRKKYTSKAESIDWKPLYDAVEKWKYTYESNTASLGTRTRHLALFDGGAFVRIEDRRSGTLRVHVLEGIYAELYRRASSIARIESVVESVNSGLCRSGVEDAINKLVDMRLMFVEDDDCLALAMANPRVRSPSAKTSSKAGAVNVVHQSEGAKEWQVQSDIPV